jgi:hypothetical protein
MNKPDFSGGERDIYIRLALLYLWFGVSLINLNKAEKTTLAEKR